MRSVRSSLSLTLVVCTLLHPLGPAAYADEASETAHADLGMAIATAINDNDQRAFGRLFDLGEFADIIGDDLFDSAKERNDYRRGFLSHGRKELIAKLFHEWFTLQLNAKYLRTLDGETPVVRLDIYEGGHEYLLLTVREKAGRLVVVDVYQMSSGRALSESLGLATQIMLKPTDSVLARLVGNRYKPDAELVSKMTRMGELNRAGDIRGAYELLQTLPDAVRDSRVMVDFAIKLASVMDDTAYQAELTRLERLYGDEESAGFMLIDYYFTLGDYDTATEKLDAIVEYLGDDAALANLHANMAYASENLELAVAHAERAIALEPNFEDGYWTKVTVSIDQKNFDEVAATLQQIETAFGYEFTADDFNDEFYSEFYRSDAMKAWLL